MNKYLDKIGSARVIAAKIAGGTIGAGAASLVGLHVLNKSIANEKQAGVQDWLDDVTGKKVKQTENIMNGMRHAASSGKSYGQYGAELKNFRNSTAKARLGVAGAAVGVAGAGLVGLHAYKEHQKKKILEAYQNLYKQAGLGSALADVGTTAVKLGVKGVKAVGKATGNTLNTAFGGKVKTFANKNGIAHGSKEMKQYNNAKAPEKLQMLKNKLGTPGPDRAIKSKQLRSDFKKLTRDQTNARIVAGAIPTAAVLGYRKGKRENSDHEADYY